jgi:glucose-1-phosphate cytidylyltransferase
MNTDVLTLRGGPGSRLQQENEWINSALRHTDFWECVDTLKDAVTLNDLWACGAPWKVWT